MENQLRLDIAFIPHLGIANSVDAFKCKRLADEINAKNPEIFGTIKKLDITSFDSAGVKTIKEIFL